MVHINELSIIPPIYGLPETRKNNINFRPIISGINKAPHNIAKHITKISRYLFATINLSPPQQIKIHKHGKLTHSKF